MLNLTATQAAIVALDNKTAKWAFYIYDKNGVGYSFGNSAIDQTVIWATGISWDAGISWSTGNLVSSGILLTDFSGIDLQRNMAENTIIAPSEVTFNISNPENVLDFLDFKGGFVLIELWLSDGTQDVKVGGWRFRIKVAQPGYQNLKITAQDFLQDYLKGYYPNNRLPEDMFPSDRTYSSDGLCVPVPFGTAYVPLRDVYIDGYGGFIMLGDPAYTYTISAIRSPRSWGLKTEYLSSGYTFTQSTKADADAVNWRVFQAIIADVNSDGTADAAGFWGTAGGNILDPPVKFTRSDTVNLTNPADIIAFTLKDMGIPAAYIDEFVTFAAAHITFDTWGLAWNGAFWYKQEREKVLAGLLTQCHAYLSVGEKIELHILSKTSKKTITGAEVLRTSEQGEGSFSYSDIVNTDLSDSGYVSWQPVDEAQDSFIKTLVAVDAVANVISSDVLECPFVQDSNNIKRIGILHFQRKYLKEAEAGFTAKGTCLALQPDDVITINADNYGGTYDVLIDSVKISKDLSIQFNTSKYSLPFQDWEDLSVVPLVVPTDDTDHSWTPVQSGPDDGANTNVLPGRIRIGQTNNYILFDPTNPLRISIYAGGVEKMRQGNLNGFLDYVTNIYGVAIGDSNNYLKYDPTNGMRIKGDITLAAGSAILWSAISGTGKPADNADVTLAAINGGLSVTGGGITLSSGGAIKGGQTAYNAGTGFFLGYESSAYKFSVGDGTNFLKWDGSSFAVSLLGSFKTAATGKRIELSVADNQMYFYGDRGDGTIENLVSIGIIGDGADWNIGVFGTLNSSRIGVYGRSASLYGVYGRSASSIGVYGLSNTYAGVQGHSTSGIGVHGSSDTSYAIYGAGNSYFTADVSALSFTDRTPHYEGDALAEITKIKSKNGQIDHSTLPAFAQRKTTVQKKITDGKGKVVLDEKGLEKYTDEPADGRDLGAMVSILTVGMQQLIDRIEKLEK